MKTVDRAIWTTCGECNAKRRPLGIAKKSCFKGTNERHKWITEAAQKKKKADGKPEFRS